ncbi:MAG: hypothetical protein FWF88_04060, partial [Peptococcaceae bacterium]|nr:hypothetical protein [Peptococcaceae bacterium]
NETDLLCSRALPPERPEHDGSFLNKEDRQEDVPKITAEENNLDTVPRFLPGETTLSSSPVQPSEKGQVKPLKAQMKQRKLVLLLTAACCVVLTVGLGVFFMLNDQGPANALAGATAQAPEPDPEPEFGSKLELESEPESEPETGSGEDPASNPETESGSNPETNTKPKSEVNTRPEDNPTPALTAPTIEIISAKPDKSTVFTGASKTQYDIYNRPYPYIESPDPVIYTIKTNVPAARLEIQNKDTYLATLATYFVNSDGTFNAEPPSANYIGTREISSDKMTWKIGKFSWNYPCIVTVTITAYDSDGKKSAPKSFTVSVQQRYL